MPESVDRAPDPGLEAQAVSQEVRTEATITCPLCGTRAREAMPTNACRRLYTCTGCGAMLKAKDGDCCVFCSYADVACPPEQAHAAESAGADA